MAKYIVYVEVQETWQHTVEIEADSLEEAEDIAYEMEDPEQWDFDMFYNDNSECIQYDVLTAIKGE